MKLLISLEGSSIVDLIRIDLEDSKGISNVYNNMALVYLQDGKHGLALEYYYKALKRSNERDDKKDIAELYENIALRKNVWLSFFNCQKIMDELDFGVLENNRF